MTCEYGIFLCAFEAVLGVGFAVLALMFIAAMLGFFDK